MTGTGARRPDRFGGARAVAVGQLAQGLAGLVDAAELFQEQRALHLEGGALVGVVARAGLLVQDLEKPLAIVRLAQGGFQPDPRGFVVAARLAGAAEERLALEYDLCKGSFATGDGCSSGGQVFLLRHRLRTTAPA